MHARILLKVDLEQVKMTLTCCDVSDRLACCVLRVSASQPEPLTSIDLTARPPRLTALISSSSCPSSMSHMHTSVLPALAASASEVCRVAGSVLRRSFSLSDSRWMYDRDAVGDCTAWRKRSCGSIVWLNMRRVVVWCGVVLCYERRRSAWLAPRLSSTPSSVGPGHCSSLARHQAPRATPRAQAKDRKRYSSCLDTLHVDGSSER